MKISNCNGERYEKGHPSLAPKSPDAAEVVRKGKLFEAKIRQRKKKA
jgi:hypothetical protein